MTHFTIRTLKRDDAAQPFRLRRESLSAAPLSFLASPEDDVASSEEDVQRLQQGATGSLVFGTFTNELSGMLGVNRGRHARGAHMVNLWGLYVRSACRGQGTGAALLAHAIAHARTLDGARSVHLGVSSCAPAARHLYERAGFVVWGTEAEALQAGAS